MDPAYIEILDTNKKLRKELANEIATNDYSEKKIHNLCKELEVCYQTISRQDSTIIAHEEEIASLKVEITSLKQYLRRVLKDVEQKEKHLLSREDQLHELENKVAKLKVRIGKLINKNFSDNTLDMEDTPIRRILDNRARIATRLAQIRLHFDNAGVTLPNDIARHFDESADDLQGIIGATTTVNNFIINRGRIINQQIARAVDAEQQLGASRAQAWHNNQMMTQALDNERQARQEGDAKINELRRSAHRYINDVGRWKRRHRACAQQAQNLGSL